MTLPNIHKLIVVMFCLSGCGLYVGNPGKKQPAPNNPPGTILGCTGTDLPAVADATGQLKFHVGDGIDPCSIKGYLVGEQSVFTVAMATDASFFIDKLPAGKHDFIITGQTKQSSLKLDGNSTSMVGVRLSDIDVFAGKQVDEGQLDLPATSSVSGKVALLGASNSAGVDVYIPGTDYIAKSADDGTFTLQNVPAGTHSLYLDASGYRRGRIEKLAVDSGTNKDVGVITLAQDTGAEGFILIAGGASTYSSRTVPIVVGASDDAVLMKLSEAADFANVPWVPLATSTTYTFAGDGTRTLYVEFANANGLASSPYSANIRILMATLTRVGLDNQPVNLMLANSSVQVSDKIMVWGGQGSDHHIINTGYVVDPKRSSWSPIATAGAPSARWDQAMVAYGTKVLVWGGYGSSGAALGDGALYDVASNQWAPINLTGAPPASGAAYAVAAGNKAFIWGGTNSSGCGGAQCDTYKNYSGAVYDFDRNTWSTVTPGTKVPLTWGAAVVWTGAKVLIWGGCDGTCSTDLLAYDIANDSWQQLPAAPIAPRNANIYTWIGKKLIIWGGSTGDGSLDDGAIYDLEQNKWSLVSTSGAPSAHGAGAVTTNNGSQMIVWGGWNPRSPYIIPGAWIYDIATNTWTGLYSDLDPVFRGYAMAYWLGDSLFIFGGVNEQGNPWGNGYLYSWNPR